MKYKVIGTRGMVPFEISGEMIDDFIKRHCYAGEIQWREYLLDESGNMCGLKGLADSGPVSYTHLTLPTICSV